jgi:hypothetical protein
MPHLESLLSRLAQHQVKFVLVEGFAAAAHGISLVTQDVDICCSFTPGNLMRLQEALADLHAVHRMTPAKLPLSITKANCRVWKNLYLQTDWGQLDCLSDVSGVGDYHQARKESVGIKLGNRSIRVLNIDALIQAKRAMDRSRDREAVVQLQAIKEKSKKSSSSPKRQRGKAK